MFATSRRRFLQQAAAVGAAASLTELGFLSRLAPVSAAEAAPNPDMVRLHEEIEPLVRLMEDTPRNRLLEEVAKKIRAGTTYREVVAAVQLAGIRNVQPRPDVGFKFHAVLVVNSAHLASINSPDTHRWLPIFWAIDNFKQAQADDQREGDWVMGKVDEAAVPSPTRAKAAFIEAMDRWDVKAADAAAAGMARAYGVNEVFEILFRYGARDFRDIGHKAIYVANALRTLNMIGYQHAEPIIRSLAYALLAHDGANPSTRDDKPDRPWRHNVERSNSIRDDWMDGKIEPSATLDLLAALRKGSEEEIPEIVVGMLNKNVAPQSIWDAMFLASGELLARKPGNIVPLHAVTTSNAMRYAWDATSSDDTRRMLLLQNAAFVSMFRQAMGTGRNEPKPFKLDEMPAVPFDASAEKQFDEIFNDISGDKNKAAGKVLTHLQEHPEPREFLNYTRLVIFQKGNNAHDYKFSSAALEDYYNVTPRFRAKYLASSVYNLKGAKARDNNLVQRTRAALA